MEKMMKGKMNKVGQVTIFIIIAILVVGGIIVYFALRNPFQEKLSKNMQPVYDYYLSCMEENARQGLALLGEQGGYIYSNEMDFVPGSEYMPFSSQLDFFGQPIPYWMYVSGNNLLREQVPTKIQMQEDLARYISERVGDCDFSSFELQGYDIFVDKDNPLVGVKIDDEKVTLTVDDELDIVYGNESATVRSHAIEVGSKMGKMYNLAIDTYNYEKQNMFLEKYAVDVLRLYAPVDGVEISCSPKVFNKNEIRNNLSDALSQNIGALKLKGDYYSLNSDENQYFVTDIGQNVDENVNFIYSPSWTTRVEIYSDDVAEPVGLQEGLGILGFCYIPYHLVYDVDFPVLIQFYNADEIFQFPISVVIDKNQERNALPTTSGESIESPICKNKNQKIDVYTYDLNLNPVEARIRFKCLDSSCEIGRTELMGEDAFVSADMPSCVNGFVTADAPGYVQGKYQISTNNGGVANVLMKRLYNVSLDLGNVESALVRFNGEDHSVVVLYPDTKNVELAEDYYNVSVYAYKNSSLVFPASNERKCINVPQSGIGGIFGAEQEKCFDINLPETEITLAVVGGGKTSEYITEEQLKDSRQLNINIPLFGVPSNLDEAQQNYAEVENEVIYLEFE